MIVVNARFLTQETTGVQRFAREIALALLQRRNDLLFVSPNVEPEAVPPAIRERLIVSGTASGHGWEQTDLPHWLRRNGSPLLVNLMSTAPLTYPNQIVTHHDVTYKRHPNSFSKKLRLFYGLTAPVFLRRSRAVVTVSEFSKSELSAVYGLSAEKIYVVRNAVSDDLIGAGNSNEALYYAPYFLAVSSIAPHKNFANLVQAFDRYKSERVSETKLLIIGSRAKSLAEEGSAVHHHEDIRYLGRLEDSELASFYMNARAFFFPSLYEGFGIPPLEAQAFGVPVAASSMASIPEVLGDSALYFDPLDTQTIVSSMECMDSDEILRTSLIRRGMANLSRFSWSESAKTIDDLISLFA